MTADPMDEARLADLLMVMTPERLEAHVHGLRAEILGLVDPEAAAPPEPAGPDDAPADDWTGLGRRAHAAAGHAQLLGFPALASLLNALESAARAHDPQAAARAISGLRAQLDAGGPRLPPL